MEAKKGIEIETKRMRRKKTGKREIEGLRAGASVSLGVEAGNEENFSFFLATLCGTRDLSSLTRDRTRIPCSGSAES